MEKNRVVMYVGLQQAPSYDRPNGRPDRVWHGPGSVVEGIPFVEAVNLVRHADEWLDVTDLNDQDRVKKAQAVVADSSERLRKLRNPPGSTAARDGLGAASDDELMAELERRKANQQKVAAASNIEPPTQPTEESRGTAEVLRQKIMDAAEAVATEAAEKGAGGAEMLDEDGIPKLSYVVERMGISVTAEEYRLALGLAEAA